jgi:hypothetical protein
MLSLICEFSSSLMCILGNVFIHVNLTSIYHQSSLISSHIHGGSIPPHPMKFQRSWIGRRVEGAAIFKTEII